MLNDYLWIPHKCYKSDSELGLSVQTIQHYQMSIAIFFFRWRTHEKFSNFIHRL